MTKSVSVTVELDKKPTHEMNEMSLPIIGTAVDLADAMPVDAGSIGVSFNIRIGERLDCGSPIVCHLVHDCDLQSIAPVYPSS
jgi:hypothetical protein